MKELLLNLWSNEEGQDIAEYAFRRSGDLYAIVPRVAPGLIRLLFVNRARLGVGIPGPHDLSQPKIQNLRTLARSHEDVGRFYIY